MDVNNIVLQGVVVKVFAVPGERPGAFSMRVRDGGNADLYVSVKYKQCSGPAPADGNCVVVSGQLSSYKDDTANCLRHYVFGYVRTFRSDQRRPTPGARARPVRPGVSSTPGRLAYDAAADGPGDHDELPPESGPERRQDDGIPF